jgi:hypothetical protein
MPAGDSQGGGSEGCVWDRMATVRDGVTETFGDGVAEIFRGSVRKLNIFSLTSSSDG